MPQHELVPVIVDPLQNLVVTISFPSFHRCENCRAGPPLFWLAIRLLSSQILHSYRLRNYINETHHGFLGSVVVVVSIILYS